MEYALISVPAAPLRRKPNHRREMTSQLLFGEAVSIIRERGSLWVKVRSLHDEYEGWLTRTLLEETTEKMAREAARFVTTAPVNPLLINNESILLPTGASLPAFDGTKGMLGAKSYSYHGDSVQRDATSPDADTLEKHAMQWLNAPYLWGGRTIFGVDCSGFVQVNFKMIGIDLPRDAWQQAQDGNNVKKLKDAQKGDLAFFDDRDEIVHVGLLLSPDTIIHASGKVRIDHIDKKGIVQTDTGKRTHQLKAIKRYW